MRAALDDRSAAERWTIVCQDWVVHEAKLPPRISRVGAQAVLGRLLILAYPDAVGVPVSAREVERKTTMPHSRVSAFLRYLVEQGWLVERGRDRSTQAMVYDFTIPEEWL